MPDDSDPLALIKEIVEDKEAAQEFLLSESEEAVEMRDELESVLEKMAQATKILFEQQQEKEVQVSDETVGWIALIRYLLNDLECDPGDVEEVWYIG